MAYNDLPTADRCWVQCLFFPWRYPLTLVCLGFLLSVSSSLWPALEHLQRITTNDATVQLFLDENISAEQGRTFMQDLSNHPEVAHADFITREVAWRDFDETVALGTEPDDTPLPDIIVVELVPGAPVQDTIEKFRFHGAGSFCPYGMALGGTFQRFETDRLDIQFGDSDHRPAADPLYIICPSGRRKSACIRFHCRFNRRHPVRDIQCLDFPGAILSGLFLSQPAVSEQFVIPCSLQQARLGISPRRADGPARGGSGLPTLTGSGGQAAGNLIPRLAL